jgi:hypothetical protein
MPSGAAAAIPLMKCLMYLVCRTTLPSSRLSAYLCASGMSATISN